MTRATARNILGGSYTFRRIGQAIALREVALIEAVRKHQRTPGSASSFVVEHGADLASHTTSSNVP